MSIAAALAIAAVLLIANAFFVAVEFALVATQRAQIESRDPQGKRRSQTALKVITDLNTQVAGAQLGITMASIALGLVAEPSVAALLEETIFSGLSEGAKHEVGLVVALALVTFLHVLLGEMVPKNIALSDSTSTVLWLAPIHLAFVRLVRPAVWLLNRAADLVLSLLKVEALDERAQAKTPQELALLLAEAHKEEVLDKYDFALLSNTLELGEQTVRHALVPWDSVDRLSCDASIAQMEEAMVQSGHSRLALVDASEQPCGWVHAKDLLSLDATLWDEPLPGSSQRRLINLDQETAVEVALERMQLARQHFALATANGEPVGIITLEDVLEILVSGLADEGARG